MMTRKRQQSSRLTVRVLTYAKLGRSVVEDGSILVVLVQNPRRTHGENFAKGCWPPV